MTDSLRPGQQRWEGSAPFSGWMMWHGSASWKAPERCWPEHPYITKCIFKFHLLIFKNFWFLLSKQMFLCNHYLQFKTKRIMQRESPYSVRPDVYCCVCHKQTHCKNCAAKRETFGTKAFFKFLFLWWFGSRAFHPSINLHNKIFCVTQSSGLQALGPIDKKYRDTQKHRLNASCTKYQMHRLW